MAATVHAPGRHAEIVRAMLEPDFYGIASEVEVRETHISYVFLAGDRAYKLKKPLVLSFADYGSAERRRSMCEAEVRLNRRLAPHTYLGVRAVVEGPAGLELAPAGTPGAIEHVVEMRRFRDSDTLAARLRSGTVKPAELETVGRVLAAFHRVAPHASAGESRRSLEAALRASCHDVLSLGSARQRAHAGALRRFAEAFLSGRGGLLDARVGLAVEGHGDLRAEHVVLHEPLEVVDCLEFDAALRRRDGASDLAFLLMDLEARGHPAAAAAVLRGYRHGGGDPAPAPLRAFYMLERAMVRAKVDLLRADQLAPGPGRRARSASADRLLALARTCAWRARGPLVLVTCGLSGSGKTSLADAIAQVSGLRVLSSDVVRKGLAGLAPLDRARDEHYTEGFSARTYAELGRMAAAGGVVVDATFRRAAARAAFVDALGTAGPAPLFVECVAPYGTMRRRLAERPRGPSDATPEVLDRQRFEPLDEVPEDRSCTVRADRTVEQVVEDVEAWLDERLGAGA